MMEYRRGEDPLANLDTGAWTLAAAVTAQRRISEGMLSSALASDPDLAAVLIAAGLLERVGGELIATPALGQVSTAASAAAARTGSLAQAAVAATGNRPLGWAAQPDAVLLDQGRASAATGQFIARRLVPVLADLADRLDVVGSRILDIGTGIGALALAIARELPSTQVVGVDNLDRALELGKRELGDAGPDADRVELRHQDILDLHEPGIYDLIWLPAPFIAQPALRSALPQIVDSLTSGGWLAVGTNPESADDLSRAVAQWRAARNGGSAFEAPEMATMLRDHGLEDVGEYPTVSGGPILVVGRRL